MDLETFFTILYVFVDDWYRMHVLPHKPKRGGPAPQMSDSEVLTVALAGQWRVGVPWRSERGVVRYIHRHLLSLFPRMVQRSDFNERTRRLWGAFVLLQEAVAEELSGSEDVYDCVDTLPLPAFSMAQAQREQGHWLWESTVGTGGTQGKYYIGDQLLFVHNPKGPITGWLIGSAYIDDRWLLEGLLSARTGAPQLIGPEPHPATPRTRWTEPPQGHIGPYQAVGVWSPRPILADKGFNGWRWQTHWAQTYATRVITVPPRSSQQPWSKPSRRWLASHRQIAETVYSHLVDVFGIKRLDAHSRWGQYTRVAAKLAAFNIGMFINQWLGRPLLALPTLLC
jgi:hypothetical protein